MTDELDDLEALAADYVLGTLDIPERWRVEKRMRTEPAFEALVRDWSRRLTPLAEAVPPVDPPPELWKEIEAGLPAHPRPAAEVLPLTERRPNVALWRSWALAATAVAAALALYIGATPPSITETRYVAVLNRGEASPSWLVSVDIADRTLTIRPLADVAVPEKDLELWLVSTEDVPPRSLGLLNAQHEISIPMSAVLRQEVPKAAALAVSLEPAGGSPTGLPTGPVLYQGAVLPISN